MMMGAPNQLIIQQIQQKMIAHKIIKTISSSPQSSNQGKSLHFTRKSARKILKTNVNTLQLDKSSNMSPNQSFNKSFSSAIYSQTADSLSEISKPRIYKQNNYQNKNLFRNDEEASKKYKDLVQRQEALMKEKRRYRDQSINKTKQLRKLIQQNTQLQNNNRKLIQQKIKLETDKQELTKKIKVLEEEMTKISHSNYCHQNNKDKRKQYTLSVNESNPFKKLKNITNFNKSCKSDTIRNTNDNKMAQIFFEESNEMNKVTKQLISQEANKKKQYEQRWDIAERNLFEARQTIKRLILEIDCIKMKAFSDLEQQKRQKNHQYVALQKKFKQLLSDHIEMVKNIRKKEISERIKLSKDSLQVSKSLHKRSSSDIISLLSLSSDESIYH